MRGSSFPLSIIVIGNGKNKFPGMTEITKIITDEDELLHSEKLNRYSERDFFQYMKQKTKNSKEGILEVIQEIPKQLLEFMEKNNIHPFPPSKKA